MYIGYNKPRADYSMDDTNLPLVDERELEVIITEDFTWQKQFSVAVNKANKLLG